MANGRLVLPPTDTARSSTLSPAGYKVLGFLRKGCAYQVRGAWRLRGVRNQIGERTLTALLTKGLAERVATDRCLQLRITPAGRSVNATTRQSSAKSREMTPIAALALE